jgi:4-amino-4-deoxy-L-arabinose transferase-like glycosyltransferase
MRHPSESTGSTASLRSRMSAASRFGLAEDWLAAALILGFFLVNLIGLDRVPFANADEAWIAEPGLRFWERGAFVSHLHAGFFGAERHYLLHAPLFSLIVGWVIWIVGPGIVQVRLVSLAMAALTAAFTYRLGRTLLSPRHGLLAALLLTWCRTGPYQWEARQSGIVLVDFGRLARYDVAVPFFGLIGVLLILPWLLRDAMDAPPVRAVRVRFVLAGACAGRATASHPMGAIGIATLLVVCVVAVRARAERVTNAIAPIAWLLLGVGLAMLPWIVFAWTGWDDMRGQQRLVAHRWNLGDPRFYAWNVLLEWRRYISVGRGLQFGIPGAWLLASCSVAGAAAVVFGPRRHGVRLRVIRAALVTGFLLLTLGDREKFFFYLATLWPWIALAVAIGIVAALHSASRLVRIGVLVLLVLGCLDGVRAEVQLARTAAARTSFATICDRLAAHLPREARVVALPTWWLGLGSHVRDYRSLTVPMFFLQPHLADPAGPTFSERLAAIDADVVLFDQAMIDYVRGPRAAWAWGPATRNPGAEELERFLERRSVRRIDLTDPSYGRFEIYYLR